MPRRVMNSKRSREPDAKRNKKRIIICLLLLIIVCICIFIAFFLSGRFSFSFDKRGVDGALSKLSEKERQELLQKAADESRFSFRINGNMSFEDGNKKGVMFIENPKENTCLLKVKITLDEDGRTLYETGYLKPGTGIGKDKLNEVLPAGEYEATAQFTAFDEDKKENGKALAGIHITIRN